MVSSVTELAKASVNTASVNCRRQHLRIAVTAVRNLHAGAHVWANPRCPDTQDAEFSRAKLILGPLLVSRGLLLRDELSHLTAART